MYYNMNKKLIRLTESDLHRIVKESVNKILNEMDWKAYQSAADKVKAQTPISRETLSNSQEFDKVSNSLQRSDSFHKAAISALKDKYGEGNLDLLDSYLKRGYTLDDICRLPGNNHLRDLCKEIIRYSNGGYKYKQGKGWKRDIRKH